MALNNNIEEIRAACMKARDAEGNCQVKALIDRVSNNGQIYQRGTVFPMEASLAAEHVRAGQVELAG
ncbi:MAG TPA: hypothetical protein VM238_06995 [Phycisphaerae bacterium]|nr:hypothetical protein [Phycisphaerae bacterium]